MFLKTIRAIARPQHFAIIDRLKRSTGLAVGDLAKAMNLSYMGVKTHCVELEKKGLLDTWRTPQATGRPEKVYRLTPMAASLYPDGGNELSLELLHCVQETYGSGAPDKLLFSYFAKKTAAYLKKVKGTSIAERAASLARLRDQDGHCAELRYDPAGGLQIVEFHCPLRVIAAAFPSVRRMEEQMFNRILHTTVEWKEERASGLTRYVFSIPTVSSHVLPQAS